MERKQEIFVFAQISCFRTSTSHDSLGHFVLLNQTGIVSGHFGEEKSLLNHTIKFG